MVDFLIDKNPFYKKSEAFKGFSRENLDGLFHPDDKNTDEAIPFCVEIGYIPLSDAVDAATADYAPRNDTSYDDHILNSEMTMENVGFTDGDDSPESYMNMKAKALAHCLEGGSYLSSQSGGRFVPDFDNPNLLLWAFPHLDPWGIGGFHNERRKKRLSLDEQLSHMLMSEDSRFEQDSDFAFVYYNIKQKKAVSENVQYKVPSGEHEHIIRDLLNVDLNILDDLQRKFKVDPLYRPDDEVEKSIVTLLAKVNLVGRKIPGTAGYKLTLRNEIQLLINFKGTPTLFITLNPADVDNPLVRVIAGEDIVMEDVMRGEDMEEHKRKLVAAKNPVSCALFFHTMISNFIKIILIYGRGRGLFGKCTSYYGTVEAQGKGTLHCHMLLWLEGHPSPQHLRDELNASDDYKHKMFSWMESIIKCELPSTSKMVVEPDGIPLPRPKRAESGRPDPGVVAAPSIKDHTPEEFRMEFDEFVEELVKEYNWHEHNATCWKYLKRGEVGTDKNCRMRIDGETHEFTTLDPETCSIMLRRWHPRIASYNDIVTFLMKCNTDVKYISSSEAAKALVYYITDYITKASLPTHVGLAALSYAIQRTNSRFPDMFQHDFAQDCRSALTTTMNSMMGKQEISHQQVMSYLVGGGDHYTPETFNLLYWGAFSRLVGENVAIDDEITEQDQDAGVPHDEID